MDHDGFGCWFDRGMGFVQCVGDRLSTGLLLPPRRPWQTEFNWSKPPRQRLRDEAGANGFNDAAKALGIGFLRKRLDPPPTARVHEIDNPGLFVALFTPNSLPNEVGLEL
jgi:hypothetical protein